MPLRSWPPKKEEFSSTARSTAPQSKGYNSRPVSNEELSPPQKPKGSNRALSSDSDVLNSPRFALFDHKAEIEYLPGLDREAANAYGTSQGKRSAPPSRPNPSNQKSGYDFDAMLRDTNISSPWRWDLHPWGFWWRFRGGFQTHVIVNIHRFKCYCKLAAISQ